MRQFIPLIMALCSSLLLACPNPPSVQCIENGNCNRFSGGVCRAAPSGNHWCSYPDEECPSGYRYSDLDVGDSVGGQCALGFQLSLQVEGSTPGVVISEPTGIECSSGSCAQVFDRGTLVRLKASSSTGAFLGWSDACSGYATCDLVMDQDHRVEAAFGAPGQALWVKKAGSSGDDMGRSIAPTPDGHLVVIGEFHNTIKIGASTFTSVGGTDVLVVKLDASTGAVIWSKQFGSTGDEEGLSIATDDAGNVYVAGSFNGSITFGGSTMQTAGNDDAFVASLNASGNYRWSYQFGGSMYDSGRRVAVRGTSVTMVGGFVGSMILNGTNVTSSGEMDTFIVNMTTDGAINWARSVGGTGNDRPNGLAIDSANNIVIVGFFGGTTNLGGSALASNGYEDVFIAKYRGADGVHLFSKKLGGVGFDNGTAVAVDLSNSIYILGTYTGSVDFGGPSPLTATSVDLFVAKYSLAGSYSWVRSPGPNLFGQSVIVNNAGDLAMSGMFCGTVTFGGPPLSSVGSCADSDKDIFAVRLRGTDGSHINSVRAGGTDLDVSWGATQFEDGRVFVIGGFSGFAEFGGEGLMSDGGYDLVVLALAPL